MSAESSGKTVPHSLSSERIARAHGILGLPFRDTPQFEATALGEHLGCRVVAKIETLNPIRSFKGRGALFFVSELSGKPRLVCASTGNFGQGMAYAAREHGLPLTVFMDAPANPLKVARMRALGADVRVVSDDGDDAHTAARRFAAEHDARLVVDGNEPAIAEGAGTIGMELMRWDEPFDAILAPLGDGALLSGMSCWCKTQSPDVRMIGVCASKSPAMWHSLRERQIVTAPARTIAEGIAIHTPCVAAVANLAALADEVLLVDDAVLIEAMRLAHRDIGLVLEPAGAAAVAALLAHAGRFRGQRIGAVLTGGNLSPEQMQQWL
jgi:threonine dehydratase